MADFDVALESSEINVTLVLERTVGGEGGGGVTSWNDLEDKPTTFPPSVHNHDDRYYTDTETDALLAAKPSYIARGVTKPDGTSLLDYSLLGDLWPSAVTTVTPSTNRWNFEPFILNEPVTVDRVAMEITTAGDAGKLARIALYTATTAWQPATLIQDFGTIPEDPGVVPALQVITISPTLTIQPGRYITVWITNGGTAYRSILANTYAKRSLSSVASAAPLRSQLASLNGSGTVASGFAAVSPKWERDLYGTSGAINCFVRYREVP